MEQLSIISLSLLSLIWLTGNSPPRKFDLFWQLEEDFLECLLSKKKVRLGNLPFPFFFLKKLFGLVLVSMPNLGITQQAWPEGWFFLMLPSQLLNHRCSSIVVSHRQGWMVKTSSKTWINPYSLGLYVV